MSTIEPSDKCQMPIWHCRGKFPHREYKPLQFISYRLYDSVPQKVIEAWKEELKVTEMTMSNDPRVEILRKRIDKYEDAGYGQCFLQDPRIASMIQENLFHFNGVRYNVLNWCIMPNHVHVLIEVKEGWTLSTIMHGWRSYTAHQANKILGRTGDFWMDEYFDRYIRDEKHLETVINYIDNNPVKAGLVDEAYKWPWCRLGMQSALMQEKQK
jgi:REP element-mobilizing transposase RayT